MQGQDVGAWVRGLLKRGSAMRQQATLERRILGTLPSRAARAAGLVGNRCAGPKFRVCSVAGAQKGAPSLACGEAADVGRRRDGLQV